MTKTLCLLWLLGIILACTRSPDVDPAPVADFTYRIEATGWGERTLFLTNTSRHATTYGWSILA